MSTTGVAFTRLVDNLAYSWWDRAAEAHRFIQYAQAAPALFTQEGVMSALAMNSAARRWAMNWETQR
jgi:hypothetical protein